jgi:hypothetical protein
MSPESLLAEKLNVYRGAFEKGCRGLFDESNEGSTSAAATIKGEVRRAVRFIAEDFAHEFNAKLANAMRSDPSVELVADKYEMGPGHIAELEELFAAPVAPIVANLDGDDIEGARGLVDDVWSRLEKRLRSKWQAYFILTFQDVSVERKAARDRKTHTSRYDPVAAETLARAQATRESMPDFGAEPEAPARAMSAWIVVAAVLALAAIGGWLLMRGH